MGVEFRGKLIFKRWSSIGFSCLLSLFFGVLVFGLGAVAPSINEADLEDLFIALLLPFMASVLIWFTFSLAVFPGIEVKNDRITVKKFMGEVDVSFGAIEKIEWQGGVGVKLKNGKKVNCVAFPNSLYSLLVKYRNFKSVALAIEGSVRSRVTNAEDGDAMWALERNHWNAIPFFVILLSCFFVFLFSYTIFRS